MLKNTTDTKTYCVNGHDRTLPDAVYPNGTCVQCAKDRATAFKRAQPFPCGCDRTPENTKFSSTGTPKGCVLHALKAGNPGGVKDFSPKSPYFCVKCDTVKTVEDFYTKPNGNPSSPCKECHSEQARKSGPRILSPEEQLRKRVRRYGLTLEQYGALVEYADNKCYICNEPETAMQAGRVISLSIDHDHACCPGEGSCGDCVRGLLCFYCNSRLSWIEKVGLSAVEQYLIGDFDA